MTQWVWKLYDGDRLVAEFYSLKEALSYSVQYRKLTGDRGVALRKEA